MADIINHRMQSRSFELPSMHRQMEIVEVKRQTIVRVAARTADDVITFGGETEPIGLRNFDASCYRSQRHYRQNKAVR